MGQYIYINTVHFMLMGKREKEKENEKGNPRRKGKR